jgi:hypothetical protein
MTLAKLEANRIMKDAIDAGFKLDCREECAYIMNGNKVLYIDWSMPEDGLIRDYYREEK